MKIRRVTTGHDANGKAVFVSDAQVDGDAFAQMPGAAFHRLWGADQVPKFSGQRIPARLLGLLSSAGWLSLHDVYRGGGRTGETHAGGEGAPCTKAFRSRLPGLAEHMERNSPGMHTTDTIDFE